MVKINFQKQFGKGTDPWYAKAERWVKKKFKNRTNFYNTYFFTPTEGRILVFPAHLNHRVSPNESHEDRISVSFNIRLSDEN